MAEVADDSRAAARRFVPPGLRMRPSVDYPDPPLTDELPIDYPAGTRWAAVLTHDIDHLGFKEHLVDGFLVRYAAGLVRDHLVRRFRPWSLIDRLAGVALAPLAHDRWDTSDALLAAERAAGVRSTWFFAMRRGTGISYDAKRAARAIADVRRAGFEVGLHGQAPDDAAALAAEVVDASRLAGEPVRGVRMHYLRLSSAALDGMARAGVRYDSTVYDRGHLEPEGHALPGPRLVRPGLLELPLHVMDSTLFATGALAFDGPTALDYTRRLVERAAMSGRALMINVHSNTYSRQTPEARSWYDGLLALLTARSDVFLTDAAGLAARVRTP